MRRAANLDSKPRLTEAQIERQCSDFLALDGWRGLKTDPCSDRTHAKGFGELGMADHLYIRYGDIRGSGTRIMSLGAEVVWIEWKRPGCSPTPRQVAWHVAERKRGALTMIAGVDFPASFEGFLAWYRNSGLLRKEGL